MPDIHFTAQSPLKGYKNDFACVTIAEITDCLITSIGIPANGREDLQAVLLRDFDLQMPEMGRFTTSCSAKSLLLRLQDNQLFLLSKAPVSHAVADQLKPIAYLADQSDSWAILSVTGDKCREALARICPVDLHRAKFPVGKVVRTLMVHLGVIIYRQSDDSFCLLIPRSSAEFFQQALEAATAAAMTSEPSGW